MIPESVERIIENEAIRKELETLCDFLRNELDGCRDYGISAKDSIKYGIERGGFLSSVLDSWTKVKEL